MTTLPDGETPEWQAHAFRTFGDAIEEIGMRAFDHDLAPEEIHAVAFIARNVLHWCGEVGEER